MVVAATKGTWIAATLAFLFNPNGVRDLAQLFRRPY